MNDEIKDMILSLEADVCGIENINRFNEVPKVISLCGISRILCTNFDKLVAPD